MFLQPAKAIPQVALPLKKVAKTYASSLRKPLTSARRTRLKPRIRKTRIRKTRRTRRPTKTREIGIERNKKILRTSAKVKTGAERKRRNTAYNKRKKKDAGMSTRNESNVNALNMKSAFGSRKLKLDREEKQKRMRGARKRKNIQESRKRGSALNANFSRKRESRRSVSGGSSTRRG